MEYRFEYLPETDQYVTANGFYLDPERGRVLRLTDWGYFDGKQLYLYIGFRYVPRVAFSPESRVMMSRATRLEPSSAT